jgi:hypothetical protein
VLQTIRGRKTGSNAMTLELQSAPALAAGAVDPIWFASYPPGVPRSIDPDSYPSLAAVLLDTCTRHAAPHSNASARA